MPLQNRVLPTGEIVANPARGFFMGNRGILHDDDRQLGTARWRHQNWVCCVLDFKGRRRPVMKPGAYTELFFLDEAVALAAGHRPCAECRRAVYLRFRAVWEAVHGPVASAAAIDRHLHRHRVTRTRTQIRHTAPAGSLPHGTFMMLDDVPHLVTPDAVRPYAPSGYGSPRQTPRGMVEVLTPKPIVAVLGAGFRPILHHSAG